MCSFSNDCIIIRISTQQPAPNPRAGCCLSRQVFWLVPQFNGLPVVSYSNSGSRCRTSSRTYSYGLSLWFSQSSLLIFFKNLVMQRYMFLGLVFTFFSKFLYQQKCQHANQLISLFLQLEFFWTKLIWFFFILHTWQRRKNLKIN